MLVKWIRNVSFSYSTQMIMEFPQRLTHEKAGYLDISPLDLGENARRDMVLNLEDMGYEVESSHHETAPAQHEIDFKFTRCK